MGRLSAYYRSIIKNICGHCVDFRPMIAWQSARIEYLISKIEVRGVSVECRPITGRFSTDGRSTTNRLPSPKDSRPIKKKNWSVIFLRPADPKKQLSLTQNQPTLDRLSADSHHWQSADCRWDQCSCGLSKQLIQILWFYSEYMWRYYNAHEVLSWFPGQ